LNALRYTVQIMNNKHKEDTATLEILQAIDNKRDVTQRHLADRLDVALGLANSYLKRCVRKGLVKIHQAPANRYFYYLTPQGLAEKSRLTGQYLSASFDFYRKASNSFTDVYEQCNSENFSKVVLAGISELAEIASLRAHENQIEIVGIYDRKKQLKEFLGVPVYSSLEKLPAFDICVLTGLDDAERMYEFLYSQLKEKQILIPSILGIKSKIVTKA
jgi:DNA-binding MarR family transcriptional regulator